jgi:TRAP-type transport system periplasmic protein
MRQLSATRNTDPDRGVRAEAIKWFAEEVEKRSNGEITIDLHWGGALVGGREVMRAVESGFVDAGTFVPSWEPELLAPLRGRRPADRFT